LLGEFAQLAVKVYERDATAQVWPQGSTLDLHHDTGLKALTVAGLLAEFKQQYCPGADKMRTSTARWKFCWTTRSNQRTRILAMRTFARK
jgi:hypothetical protein